MKYVKEIIAIFLAVVISSVISRQIFDKETQIWPYRWTSFAITGALYAMYLFLTRQRKEA